MTPRKPQEIPLSATHLAQYATTRGRCERFLRFSLIPSESDVLIKRYDAKPEVLSPMLSEAGNVFEREVLDQIAARVAVTNLQNKGVYEFIETLRRQAEKTAIYFQVKLEGVIGDIKCEGRADLIQMTKNDDGSIDALVIDVKSSRRESTSFRLQIAFYARLLKDIIAEAAIGLRSIRGAVVSRLTDLSNQALEPFEIDLYEDEIERLIASPYSDVARVLDKNFEDAGFHLSQKCDGCPHNPICFIDAAEREDLSITPLLTATEKNALRSEGIKTARDLATMMNYDQRGMKPAPGREADVARAVRRWPLGGRLPILAQRARAAMKHYDRRIESKPFILGSGFGSLPDVQRYPDLIQIFIDAQTDYIEDRVYLIAGLIVAPDRTIEIVEMAEAPPDTDDERELMIAWLTKLLPAIGRAAGAEMAPLHVYLFDGRDQRVLLDALTRHFDALCAIPAFYDLLTSSPALTQGMISFLADEVCERQNLPPICQNLYRVAGAMGFDWREGGLDFWDRFHARTFDFNRRFARDPKTKEFRGVKHDDEPGAVSVESKSRFSAQIPLEYAYAAWGALKETETMSAEQIAQIRGFLGVTKEEICKLAVRRCRALCFIEQQFSRKNRFIEKTPLDLTGLGKVRVEPHEVPLNRSLEDFLLLEHHAKHQAALLYLSQPPELRAQTGRTAILKCEQYARGDDGVARGVFVLTQPNEPGALRLREGSWVVLNPLFNEEGQPRPAGAVVSGRLCVIEKVEEGRMELRLLRLSFKKTRFRYSHWNFDPLIGMQYTLDEMLDNLNADKHLEACRNADHNQLYRWMNEAYLNRSALERGNISPRSSEGNEEREEGETDRAPSLSSLPSLLRGENNRLIRPSRLRVGREIAGLAAQSQKPFGLTDAQREIVGERFTERALVVQGPPGTGKSHTIGFAILARALALKSPARPFRAAIAAKTHSAVEIVLASVAKRMNDLLAAHKDDPRLKLLSQSRIIKIGAAEGEIAPDGVELILTEGNEEQSAGEQWQDLMTENLLIVGGTPGGLYRLVKEGSARGRRLDWSEEYFDLVVVDEASQMSITEALTATAFLNRDGQFIAVGDHRQMPPILAHAWDRDNRRDLRRARPHLSIFEYLIELGFPRAALDESFRIPAEIADFLDRHVYASDGINYRSQNRRRLAAAGEAEEWVAAALAPEHALILIEHDEEGSQQANEFEAAVIESLVLVAANQLNLDAENGIGVVAPHRAQKALLAGRLPDMARAIDTVERFQGGERELIIVSATVSDREYAQSESEFLLDPRRLTVAVSRPKRKLIVLAARSVFDVIPSDLDEYERGSLWKRLRRDCAGKQIWEGKIGAHRSRIFAI